MKINSRAKILKIFEKVLSTYDPGSYEINEIGNGARSANELCLTLTFPVNAVTEESGRKIHDEIEAKYHPGFSSFGWRGGDDDWAAKEIYLSLGWNISKPAEV